MKKGDYILMYQVIEFDGNDIKIKGIFSNLNKAKEKAKELYNKYNKYHKRLEENITYDVVSNNGTKYIVNESSVTYKLVIVEIECEIDSYCNISVF